MHDAARAAVIRAIDALNLDPTDKRVCEVGSYNVNGTIRDLFDGCKDYTGVDVRKGSGVDEVADGATFGRANTYDIVVSTETLEHAPEPQKIVANAFRILKPGGAVILTAAGPERPEHGSDGGARGEREHYANIAESDLRRWLRDAGFSRVHVERNNRPYHDDVYSWAVKPEPDGDA
jgi:SAM-dependent methyltransferase